MATFGINVSDEQKSKAEAAAEAWAKAHGGTRADFLTAMLETMATAAAKEALPGRRDEIESFETRLSGLRDTYMASLAMAQAAKEEAATARQAAQEKAAAEVEKAKSIQCTLQNRIDELEAEVAEITKRCKAAEEERDSLKMLGKIEDRLTAILDAAAQQNQQKNKK